MASNPELRPPAEQFPNPALILDVPGEIDKLHNSEAQEVGASRKRLVRYPDFRISLNVLKAGTRIEEHHNPGRISVHTVAGHIRMRALGKTFDLPQGRMLILDRAVRHDVEAVEDSAFLLTSVPPEPAQP